MAKFSTIIVANVLPTSEQFTARQFTAIDLKLISNLTIALTPGLAVTLDYSAVYQHEVLSFSHTLTL